MVRLEITLKYQFHLLFIVNMRMHEILILELLFRAYEKAITSNINKVHIPCFIYEHPGVVGFRNEIINQIFKVKVNLIIFYL